MVVTAEGRLGRAFVVPDEQTWTMCGLDPTELGVEPVFEPYGADRILAPDRLPTALAEPLRAYLDALGPSVSLENHRLFLPGDVATETVLSQETHDHGAEHGDQEEHAEHADHDQHTDHGDHGDMMAIVGDPSADGLVMEPIEFRLGPLGTVMPGGIVVDVTLDGDVVSDATVDSVLQSHGVATSRVPKPPDPWASAAWRTAIAAAATSFGLPPVPAARWLGVAAIELERVVSHLAWLRAFGRLLAFERLVHGATGALRSIEQARARIGPVLDGEHPAPGDLSALHATRRELEVVERIAEGRALRVRTAGRGRLAPDDVLRVGVRGPLARASGIADDARLDDPLYEALGFAVTKRSEGDALARTLVRVAETRTALELVSAALLRAGEPDVEARTEPATAGVVEGPRGPLRAERTDRGWSLRAAGAAEALAAAGNAMVGAEWAAALVAVASFDLSPWRVEA